MVTENDTSAPVGETSRNEISPQSTQVRFSLFVQHYNMMLMEPTIDRYHLTKQEGLALVNTPDASQTVVNTAEAMLEQLNWYAEFCGDREAGNLIQPEGYPDNHIFVGDARELMRYIPDQSVDLIFTDPPYLREHIPLYGWLAQEADRVLTPDGFLMAYVGGYWKDGVMAQMRQHMEYFWDYTIIHGGALPLVRNRNTRAGAKSILCYRKHGSKAMPQTEVQGSFQGTGASKEYHHWGQPVDETAYYISCFSEVGDLILDPFVGGGTTAVACAENNRAWIGFEMDEEYAHVAQQRVNAL